MKNLMLALMLGLTIEKVWYYAESVMNFGFIWAEDGRIDIGLYIVF